MSAGTQVCRYQNDRASTAHLPIKLASRTRSPSTRSLLSGLTQHQYWSASTYPAKTSFRDPGPIAPKKLETPTQCNLDLIGTKPACTDCKFRFSVFAGPVRSAVQSQSTVRVHLNRMMFGCFWSRFCPLMACNAVCTQKLNQLCPLLVGGKELKLTTTTKEAEQKTVTPQVCSEKPMKMEGSSSSCVIPPSCGASCRQAHAPEVTNVELEECNECCEGDCEYNSDEESGDECDEYYGCDSDSDDCDIQFSDEPASPDHNDTTIAHPKNLISLFSQESGYCENGSDSPSTPDEWSNSDNEEEPAEEIDADLSDKLWRHFQVQAFPPSVCPQQPYPTCRIAKSRRPTANIATVSNSNLSEQGHVAHIAEAATESESKVTEFHQKSPHEECCTEQSGNDCDNTKKANKRVCFKPDTELAVVHNIIAWDYAYRAARKGPWEQYARDRMHFKRRIESVAPVLEPCLAKKLACCGVL